MTLPKEYFLLTVVGPTGVTLPGGAREILCRCACGSEVRVPEGDLKQGSRRISCGCARAASRVREDASGWTPEAEAMLGKRSDGDIGRLIGYSATTVATRRKAKGIPAFRPEPSAQKGADREAIDKIVAARVAAGLTQAELAAKLEVHHSYVSLLESGRRGINSDIMDRIAAELGVDLGG